MKYLFIAAMFGIFGSACGGLGADQVHFFDVTQNVPLVKSGKVFAVEDVRELENVGPVHCSSLVYVIDKKKICPLGDIRIIEEILVQERFQWGDVPEIRKAFIPSFMILLRGLSGNMIMDESYYNIRRVDDPEDGDVFTHLEEECPAPKISVVGDQWSIVFCVIKEYIGVSPIDRYTIGGNISPFRIKSLTVESVDFTPSIVLKKPLPR